MIKIYQDYKNKRKYPRLEKFIYEFLHRHKKDLPRFIRVWIYDYEAGLEKSTGICRTRNPKRPAHSLDINLRQIMRLYKTNDTTKNIKERVLPGKIKGFRKFLLFVLYHEIGHNVLKQDFFPLFTTSEETKQDEINCDIYAYNKIMGGQLEFNWPGV